MPKRLLSAAVLPVILISCAFAQSSQLPTGTTVAVRTSDAIDSKTAEVGATFKASLDAPLMLDGKEAAPKGAEVILRLTEGKNAGKLAGKTVLTVALASITGAGQQYVANNAAVSIESNSKGKSSAKKVGFGTALGAGIGALAGGGKGAAIGAGAGAAAGTALAVATGPEVKIPSEALLSFKVE